MVGTDRDDGEAFGVEVAARQRGCEKWRLATR
jgi:hypothetical protein